MYHIQIVTALLLCLFQMASAQKPSELKKNGEKAFDDGRWSEARQLLSAYQEQKPGDNEVLTKLGIAHFQLHEPVKARKYLEYISANAPNAEACYYLGRSLHGLKEWEKAITAYKTFIKLGGDKHPLRANAIDQIKRCVSGQGILPNEAVALVENLGNQINSAGDEFAPLPSHNFNDRIYYSAAKQGSVGDLRNDLGYEDRNRGHYCSDMMTAKRMNSGWEYAGTLGSLLNTSRFEVPLGFDANGQVLYFFRGFTLFSGEFFADTATRKDEYAITPPALVSPMRPEEGDRDPYFFNDSVLIFSSRRSGGFGGLDLWIAQRTGKVWSDPENLGAQINTGYDEQSPFLAKDGHTLWFSSNHTRTMGGLDVYKSVFNDKKAQWASPVNAGTPINSTEDDAFFRLTADGQTAYFSSDRLEDNFGNRDIYAAYFKEVQTEQVTTKPILFTESAKKQAAELANEQRRAVIPSILYDGDQDILSPENQKILNQVAALSRQMPSAMLMLTVHSNETGPAKFDLYNGIKRAEIAGKYLVEHGVVAEKLVLRSVGTNYPLAKTFLEGKISDIGLRLNRRLEISLNSVQDKLPIEVALERPVVSELILAPGTAALDAADKGVAFRVEAVTTRQMLQNDALAMFGDQIIESSGISGNYRYCSGLFKSADQAVSLRNDLQKQGFTEAKIVALVHGIVVSKAEAVGLLKKFPDLAGYIRS